MHASVTLTIVEFESNGVNACGPVVNEAFGHCLKHMEARLEIGTMSVVPPSIFLHNGMV